MDDRRNYYRVLHLQPDAPGELVRVNFRTLMQKLGAHPDLGGEHWTAAHLNAAYETLRDPARREAYDLELLAAYDIQILSGGGRTSQPSAASSVLPEGTNLRSYYRVLQCQPDAPLEVLQASYDALRGQGAGGSALLDEAMAVLGSPVLREAYDALLAGRSHPEAAARIRRGLRGDADYQPLIHSYCAFCMTPHASSAARDAELPCVECQSPLFPPPPEMLEQARRAVSRVRRNDPVALHFDWPGPVHEGRVLDLSPTGMRFRTAVPLDPGDVVKVGSRRFDAVGAVAHREADGEGICAGLRFLTVRFPASRGNFVSLQA